MKSNNKICFYLGREKSDRGAGVHFGENVTARYAYKENKKRRKKQLTQ